MCQAVLHLKSTHIHECLMKEYVAVHVFFFNKQKQRFENATVRCCRLPAEPAAIVMKD